MPITPLFAAVFAIFYILLSIKVIRFRLSKQISLGDAGDTDLETAVRSHGNFIEYVPISLILMWFLEVITYSSSLSMLLGLILLVSRFAHVIGLNDTKNKLIFRQVGMLGTFFVILVAASYLIWYYIPNL